MELIDVSRILSESCGYTNFKQKSSKRLYVIVSGNRQVALSRITDALKPFGAFYDKTLTNVSSIGAIVLGDLLISVKPDLKVSAGLDNENFLIESIQKHLPKSISFVTDKKVIEIPNVISVQSTGKDIKNRKKADMHLVSADGKITPISIKKDNAAIWESADSYWADKAKAVLDGLLEDGLVHLTNHGSYVTLEPNVAVRAQPDEKIAVVFGSDLLYNGYVITRTFSEDDFHMAGQGLDIFCSHIFDTPEDISGKHDVWFLIRNDRTRNTKGLYPGIRVLAVYEERLNKNILLKE